MDKKRNKATSKAHVNKQERGKVDRKAIKGILIRYDTDDILKSIMVSRYKKILRIFFVQNIDLSQQKLKLTNNAKTTLSKIYGG